MYIYIYIYIYFSFPLGGGFMESGTQPSRPNFPCLLRILYEASTVGTECAPSMWPPGNSSGLGVTIVLLPGSGVALNLIAPLDWE